MSQDCEINMRDGLPAAAGALMFPPTPSMAHPHHHPIHSPTIFAQMSHFLLSLRDHHKLRQQHVVEDEDEEGPFDLSGNIFNGSFIIHIGFIRYHQKLKGKKCNKINIGN